MKSILAFVTLLLSQNLFAASTLPSRGPEDASVKVIMYGDFQCPFCKIGVDRLNEAIKDFPKNVRVVFRNYPLGFHESALFAAQTGVCAESQGKFWQFHDLVYGQATAEISKLNDQKINQFAEQVGLDRKSLDDCRNSNRSVSTVERDMEEGELLGLTGTPMFVFVGPEGVKRMAGAYPAEDMKAAIKTVGGIK